MRSHRLRGILAACLLLGLVAWLVSCSGVSSVGFQGIAPGRWHDDEKLVTCWLYNGNASVAISCIPDWQLTPR